jgi:hypothetical protein
MKRFLSMVWAFLTLTGDTPSAKVMPPAPVAPPKFCIDCRHRNVHPNYPKCGGLDQCFAPQNTKVNFVNGSAELRLASCRGARDHEYQGFCGSGARWFQPIKNDIASSRTTHPLTFIDPKCGQPAWHSQSVPVEDDPVVAARVQHLDGSAVEPNDPMICESCGNAEWYWWDLIDPKNYRERI